jgi:hypothetical protein
LQPDAGHDVNGQFQKVGWIGIELDKIIGQDFGLARGALQTTGRIELPLGLFEQLLQHRRGLVFLGQHPARGHLANIGRGQVDPVLEPILQLGQLHPSGVDGRDHFIQLLLGSDHHPDRSHGLPGFDPVLADLAKLLHHGP